jgi:hypothetical protein
MGFLQVVHHSNNGRSVCRWAEGNFAGAILIQFETAPPSHLHHRPMLWRSSAR